MTYNELRKVKYSYERLRAYEILYSIIADLENDDFDADDFENTKDELLRKLYSIKIGKLTEHHILDDFEEKLYEVLGENFILYIPTESNLVKKMKKIYNEKRGIIKWKILYT